MEIAIPMLFSFWMCVVYVIFSVIMIGIWVCIGIMGGPLMRFDPPKPPEVPPLPEPPDFTIAKEPKPRWIRTGSPATR